MKNKKRLATIIAVLCVVIIAAVVLVVTKWFEAGAGIDAGGSNMDAEAGIYSIAVYPPNESEENVAHAQIISLSEEEAYSFEALGETLPVKLPEGYTFAGAYLYDTTMKDSTKYYLLRVTYANGKYPEEIVTEDGGILAPDFNEMPDEFIVTVTNYAPTKDIKTFTAEDIGEIKVGGYWIEISEGVYCSFEAFEISDNEMMIIIESMD